ncbi:putative serine carboxypeptidase-like 25-like [Capsicum annuum]|uniref:uncharacterized protein LOC107861435 n=1 Tax=Capsicum annuum TaxID=4072 RepID=UPI0007BF80E6|nr:uncharacterized protein LOC107861435 [Capsicum annuum]KAF3654246.1 putative serine carboxypeptidase-like 25-like [Capsicum annuum]KAF3657906.1 putative serine carboxypeptidase-like 25-like [Capsicum annuum]
MEGIKETVVPKSPINETVVTKAIINEAAERIVVVAAEPKTPPLNRPTIVLPNSPIKSENTPDRLKVPKPFKYPERYTSPTDQMMSPVSKRLLIVRSRKASTLLPPSKDRPLHQHMVQGLRLQESGLCRTLNC